MKDLKSLLSSLSRLTKKNKYVIVSHFIGDPDEILNAKQADLDIICDGKKTKKKIIELLACKKIYRYLFSGSYQLEFNNKYINLDLFTINDGFYPKKWAKKMISDASMHNGIIGLSQEDSKYSCLYHQFFHKKFINENSIKKIQYFFHVDKKDPDFFLDTLIDYMDKNKYKFVVTLDKTRTNNFNNEKIKARKKYPISFFIKHRLYSLFITLPRYIYLKLRRK